ncbi:MAG: MBL fold metallo-hydrolase [Muribaculaceae bacterium]|nr:MBL fold metallo-hydrolase [Muribaculaceae bacterium]
MKIHRFEFNIFGVNTYVAWDAASLEAAVIDPGMANPEDMNELSDFISRNKLQITYLINTHLHIDHTLGDEYVEERYGVGLAAHPLDDFLGSRRDAQAAMFHLPMAPAPLTIDVPLKATDRLYFGKEYLEVLSVPGHSPGSIALYNPQGGFVVTGDALFAGGIGRTDLPGGDYGTLIRSITDTLLTLPPDTVVYPGHGPASTIGQERNANPYL